MDNESPCVFEHTCGFDICMKSACQYYEPKVKGRKWFEEEDDEHDPG